MGTTTAATTAGDDGMALPSASSFATAPCTATAPDVQGPAITPPRTGTLKNTILFATKIASNASVPWLKFVTDTVIQIVERVEVSNPALCSSTNMLITRSEEMKSNEEAARSLEGDIKAFLYIITRAATLDPAVEIVDEFVQYDLIKLCSSTADRRPYYRRVQSIRDQMPAPGKSFLDFSNAEKTKDIITGLSNGLDKAVQLFQVGFKSRTQPRGQVLTQRTPDWSPNFTGQEYG